MTVRNPLRPLTGLLVASALMFGPGASAQDDGPYRIAWSIYAGWMPWQYIGDSGIMDRWAERYGIEVEIVQVNDYIESINQYTAGAFEGVVATSMDSLSIPAASGVDTTALIVGDYSNGNDGLVLKGSDDLADVEGRDVHLVELSVSHYLLARALDSVGLQERDVNVVNLSDADLVAAFDDEAVTATATWQPLLDAVLEHPEANLVFDSSEIPGHIKDLLVVNTEALEANPDLGRALVGAWYEMMTLMSGDDAEAREIRTQLGEASGTDLEGYDRQLAGMRMFYEPTAAVDFIESEQAREAMAQVRDFSFRQGLLGEGAPSPDFIGIEFPDGEVLGRESNVRLRFTSEYMRMAAEGAL
ncbi:putative urea ABC transporter substrate-binding protein [Sediminicurvatus halobius]|uniref:Lipid kinase n=1 Tax=Sediminicurvatus halobius TaxID=2182432 RepID=A0A2U2N9I6_9GAMM|nr:putative urea ABC transporter substrate-binding protein [Spiribacter halobius]PWG65720.1 lipid kinase [Spiribacter halobius]UEX77754.1 putative urea ABC transporter substrate-binding protein [Spiribacter halobius]